MFQIFNQYDRLDQGRVRRPIFDIREGGAFGARLRTDPSDSGQMIFILAT